jgi:enamine deaminase RidA (YjgF/YER057c/UK114 family)
MKRRKLEEKKAFQTDKAAVTGGPYSQAIIHNGIIYVAGLGAVDPQTNEIKLGTVEEEAELGLENLRIILEEAGSIKNILKKTARREPVSRRAISPSALGWKLQPRHMFKGQLAAGG